MSSPHPPTASDYLAVAAAAAAALGYEIILLRVFSFSQWHHFASLAVSLALLGFGAAGTTLALLGRHAARLGDRLFVGGLVGGAAGMLLAYALPQWIPVRPVFAVWDSGELLRLLLLDFSSFIPFYALALSLGQVFLRWPAATPGLYAANLLGSGAGCLGAALLLGSVHLETALLTVPAFTLLTAGLHAVPDRRLPVAGWLCLALALTLGVWTLSGLPHLPVSDLKPLAMLKDLPDARVLERHAGLREEVAVIRSASIRISPGLSLQWTRPVTAQDAMVIGADTIIPLPRTTPDRSSTAHLRATLGALPFLVRPDGPAVVIGTSDWLPLFLSQGRPASWVEENPVVVELLSRRGLPKQVRIFRESPRSFLHHAGAGASVIFLATTSAEGDAAAEDYLLTREGLERAFGHLTDDGVLAIPLSLSYPPRHAPRMLNTLITLLRERATGPPEAHLAMLRSMQQGIILLSRAPWSESDLQSIRRFAHTYAFDLVALPGLQEEETNLHHQLPVPLYHQVARSLLHTDTPLPPEASWYAIEVPDDNRPYFWRSMLWRNVPRLLEEFGRQGLIWLDWPLLATLAKLVVAGLLAFVLILIPLGRLPSATAPLTRPRICLYFAALGLGFLLLEMAVLQRAILYLSHPVIAASLIFAVFLIGAGFGSLTTATDALPATVTRIFGRLLLLALLTGALTLLAPESLFSCRLHLRAALIAMAIAPLAWALGRPMPWGLRQLDPHRALIPWAWGINGFASVLAAPLATLISNQYGQLFTWIAGLACYALAFSIARSWTRPRS